MIYHISEIGDDIGQCFIDTSKLDMTNTDHVVLLKVINLAATDSVKGVDLQADISQLEKETVEDLLGDPSFTVRPPCHVDDSITFYWI